MIIIQLLTKMVEKLIKLRILEDEHGKINNGILESNLEILSISQFTLYAATKKDVDQAFQCQPILKLHVNIMIILMNN